MIFNRARVLLPSARRLDLKNATSCLPGRRQATRRHAERLPWNNMAILYRSNAPSRSDAQADETFRRVIDVPARGCDC